MKIGIILNLDAKFDTQKYTDTPVTARLNHKMSYVINIPQLIFPLLEIQNSKKHISYY